MDSHKRTQTISYIHIESHILTRPKKRGRGRPRKYPIGESPAEKLQAAREQGTARGRGRPRKKFLVSEEGDQNKPVAAKTGSEQDDKVEKNKQEQESAEESKRPEDVEDKTKTSDKKAEQTNRKEGENDSDKKTDNSQSDADDDN